MQYFQEDVCPTFDVSSRQGWEFLRHDASSRRRHNGPSKEETRGRKSLVSPEKIGEMERILETEGIEARAYTWEQLGYIPIRNTGIEYGLVTKFTLDRVHKTNCTLFASQVCDPVTHVSKKTPRKTESAIIVGRPLVMILNQTSTSMR